MEAIIEAKTNKIALIRKGVIIPPYSKKNPAIMGPKILAKLFIDCTIPITLPCSFCEVFFENKLALKVLVKLVPT